MITRRVNNATRYHQQAADEEGSLCRAPIRQPLKRFGAYIEEGTGRKADQGIDQGLSLGRQASRSALHGWQNQLSGTWDTLQLTPGQGRGASRRRSYVRRAGRVALAIAAVSLAIRAGGFSE